MDLKAISSGAIDRSATQLREMSDTLWTNPEVALEEHMAHDVLTGLLREHGFQVDEHHTMETAFRARAGGDQGVNVAVICEYDALPDIGHACGHNLIAEAGQRQVENSLQLFIPTLLTVIAISFNTVVFASYLLRQGNG